MSGLLQRLAGQAVAAARGPAAASRLRPAASVHAHAAIAMPVVGLHDSPSLEVPASRMSAGRTAVDDVHDASAAVPREIFPSTTQALRDSVRAVESGHSEAPPAFAPDAREPAAPGRLERAAARDRNAWAPQALLAEVAAAPAAFNAFAPIAPAGSPRIASEAAQARSSAEPTEVHVHIGRIEVTAVQEPAEPKKTRTITSRNTLPLAEYLAQRRRT